VGAGEQFACALSAAGGVTCWGSNQFGQLNVPAAVASAPQASIAVGQYHACALSEAWGMAPRPRRAAWRAGA
jgi:alpha-tubulin suppressor-like RCC1 family protein